MSNFQETPRHVQYISVANLPTHSVTIYPKSAIVLREIKDIVIEVLSVLLLIFPQIRIRGS